MTERLTDEELADVAARIDDPRCHACEGRGLVPVCRDVSVDCRVCDGTGNFALSTRTMATILAELRALRLSSEEREALRWLEKYTATCMPSIHMQSERASGIAQRSLAVLARILEGK